jgi:hypothetical protein
MPASRAWSNATFRRTWPQGNRYVSAAEAHATRLGRRSSRAQTPELNGHAVAKADAVEAADRPAVMARPMTVPRMARVLVRMIITPLESAAVTRAYPLLCVGSQHICAP